MVGTEVLGLLNNLSSNVKEKMGSHSIIVVLPLSVITVFCFSYVLMQPAQTSKKDTNTAASKRPSLFTGGSLPEIKSDAPTDTSSQKLLTENQDSTTPASINSTTTPNSTTSVPQTTNPQSAASSTYMPSNYSNQTIKTPATPLSVKKTVSQILNNLNL